MQRPLLLLIVVLLFAGVPVSVGASPFRPVASVTEVGGPPSVCVAEKQGQHYPHGMDHRQRGEARWMCRRRARDRHDGLHKGQHRQGRDAHHRERHLQQGDEGHDRQPAGWNAFMVTVEVKDGR